VTHTLRRVAIGAALLTIGTASSLTAEVDDVRTVRFSGGISATIITADYLRQHLSVGVASGSHGLIRLDDGTEIWVIVDINDPAIANKGDGSFHAYDYDLVVDALAAIECPGMDLDVEILILPYPRANTLVSSASGNRIFLSPQVAPVSPANAAYVVTHELGHVFQGRYLPDMDRDRGIEYRNVRGIEDLSRFHVWADHSMRPNEIFAEDFRVLFGGELARFEGRVENTSIVPPLEVSGLKEFFGSLVAARVAGGPIVSVGNYPNPFNPSTQLRVVLDPDETTGRPVTIDIYDVRGALVRELYTGPASSSELRVQWDGRDQRGAPVSSAVYFGVVRAGGTQKTHKLLLVK
jgi:hypothetical protein